MILKIILKWEIFLIGKEELENWKTEAYRIHTDNFFFLIFKVGNFSYIGFTIDFISHTQKWNAIMIHISLYLYVLR